jgi:hypothetical protein
MDFCLELRVKLRGLQQSTQVTSRAVIEFNFRKAVAVLDHQTLTIFCKRFARSFTTLKLRDRCVIRLVRPTVTPECIPVRRGTLINAAKLTLLSRSADGAHVWLLSDYLDLFARDCLRLL